MKHNAETQIEFNSVLLSGGAEPGVLMSHRKIIRRWNQLSRLQRFLVYIGIIICGTSLVLLYNSRLSRSEQMKSVASGLTQDVQDQITNNTLVIQPPAEGILQLVDSPVKQDKFERIVFPGPSNDRQRAVVSGFEHAWRGYRAHAWGRDNLKPLSAAGSDWFSLGLTIVDSLDTAYIMGLTEEFEQGRSWVRDELVFTRNKDVNLFEVTIRVLGALLACHRLSGDDMFLRKAEDLGERLLPAFQSPSGIPYSDVNLATRAAHAPEWSHYSSTAEVTTVQLEFRELSRATGRDEFETAAARVSQLLHALPKRRGLVPIFLNPATGQFLPHATITLGARGDSYYEYLLKQWLQTGKTQDYLVEDYLEAIEGVRELLARRSSPGRLLFIGELSSGSEAFNPKMDHLTCFLPGTLALGHAHGLPSSHLRLAEDLLNTCYRTYAAQPTFLAPEITHFNMASATTDMYTKSADAHSLLRPEFVESLWYMYELTGNDTYQEWGWQVFQAIEKHAKVPNGYTSLGSVLAARPPARDMMESFFLSETLKYLYLLFGPKQQLDLRRLVLNTEAHPLPIYDH